MSRLHSIDLRPLNDISIHEVHWILRIELTGRNNNTASENDRSRSDDSQPTNAVESTTAAPPYNQRVWLGKVPNLEALKNGLRPRG